MDFDYQVCVFKQVWKKFMFLTTTFYEWKIFVFLATTSFYDYNMSNV
jgi:hypothetical protein